MSDVTIEVMKVRETADAVLVNDGEDEYWIPLSKLVSLEPVEGTNRHELVIPEWLAVEKGMV